MAKSYSGLDKAEAFFAHYGRKGMKRGMNIYNPNYKPIGEKARLTNESVQAKRVSGIKLPKAPGSAGLSTTDPRFAVKKGTLASTDPRFAVKKGTLASTDPRFKSATSSKDREKEAMSSAANAATALGAANAEKTRREKLMDAERKRQAVLDKERSGKSEVPKQGETASKTKEEQINDALSGKSGPYVDAAFKKDYINSFANGFKENVGVDLLAKSGEIAGYRDARKAEFENDSEAGRQERRDLIKTALNALGDYTGDSVCDIMDSDMFAIVYTGLAAAAGQAGWDNVADYVQANATDLKLAREFRNKLKELNKRYQQGIQK